MKETLEILRAELDTLRIRLVPLLDIPPPTKGWIATIRAALGMPQHILAKRLSFSKQRVSQLEAREETGDLTLTQMSEAARALDCKFVYAFIPIDPLTKTVQKRARAYAREQLAAVDRTMQLEDQQTPIDEKRIDDYVRRHVTERDLWRS